MWIAAAVIISIIALIISLFSNKIYLGSKQRILCLQRSWGSENKDTITLTIQNKYTQSDSIKVLIVCPRIYKDFNNPSYFLEYDKIIAANGNILFNKEAKEKESTVIIPPKSVLEIRYLIPKKVSIDEYDKIYISSINNKLSKNIYYMFPSTARNKNLIIIRSTPGYRRKCLWLKMLKKLNTYIVQKISSIKKSTWGAILLIILMILI